MIEPIYTIDDDGNAVFPLPPAKDGMAVLDYEQLRMALADPAITGILIDFGVPIFVHAGIAHDFVLEAGRIEYSSPNEPLLISAPSSGYKK